MDRGVDRFFQYNNRLRLIRLAICLMMLLLGSNSSLTATINGQQSEPATQQSTTPAEPLELKKGQLIEKPLNGGQSHRYAFKADADQYFDLVVEQLGIDVAVALYAPDGKKIYEVDSPNGIYGPEPAYLITEQSGLYQLEISSGDQQARAGRYQIKLQESTTATATVRELYQARLLITQLDKMVVEGKYKSGLPIAEQALAIRERLLGSEHPLVADSLNYLAFCYSNSGDIFKAEPLYQRALAIYQKVLGPDNDKVADSLNYLGQIYSDRGELAKAEPFFLRALAIREKLFGPQRPEVSEVLNNLGVLYYKAGDYTKSEDCYQRALSIDEKCFGPNDNIIGIDLNNLASIYVVKGDYQRAKNIYQQAMAIEVKALGSDHPNVAIDCINLAALYHRLNEYDKAEELYRRGLAIEEKSLGPGHSMYAQILNNLAEVLGAKGDYAQQETMLKRAIESTEKVLGRETPDQATFTFNLAVFYFRQGEYAKAEPLYLKSLALREKLLGLDHPDVCASLNELSLLYLKLADLDQAIKYRARADEVRERELVKNLVAGSEREKIIYLNLTAIDLDRMLSLHLRFAADNKAAARLAMTAILRRKGRALDAMTDSIATLRHRANPQDQELFDQLASARAQYATVSLHGPGKEPLDQYQTKLKTLADRLEKLEYQLSSHSAQFKAQSQPITLATVQQAIPENSALIEFVSYQQLEAQNKVGSRHYAVYLLTNQGEPLFADLGAAETIDQAANKLRGLLPNERADIDQEIKPAARALDELVMRPVRALLKDQKILLISPDSLLNLIPFDALVDEQSRYLVENYQISYLTSGRDLLRLQVHSQSKPNSIIFANPSFSKKAAAINSQAVSDDISREVDLRTLKFAPLFGTADEAKAIAAILPEVALYQQEQASEENLKQVDAPLVLHIATHGFFLAQSDSDNGQTETANREPNAPALINPMLRSGLALAGANLRDASNGNEGILTALEASGLNLFGTKLVVLSACNTGVGEVKNGDGVYGLRRALVLAGSETQMMSLWPVSDKGTRDLMIAYYNNLKAGIGRRESLRAVQLQMLKDAKKRHPFYWASFIQSGEWANLSGKR